MHKFVILLNGELKTYTNYQSIPDSFDNLIEFSPEIPAGPHDESQHDEIDQWNSRLQELMKRETK